MSAPLPSTRSGSAARRRRRLAAITTLSLVAAAVPALAATAAEVEHGHQIFTAPREPRTREFLQRIIDAGRLDAVR